MSMAKLLAALVRKLDSKGEPGFVTRLTLFTLALCVLVALVL
jgi:hypothetical protein